MHVDLAGCSQGIDALGRHWSARLVTQAPADLHGWLYHLFYDWQTLWAGALALLAAWLTVRQGRQQLSAAKAQVVVGREQIAEQRRQADRDRQGRLRAARASLPATLSAVCDHAQAAAQALNAAWPVVQTLYPEDGPEWQVHTISAVVPDFPVPLIAPLERMVELTDVDAVAERIESILRESQVLGARTRKLHGGETQTTRDLAGLILQAAAIYARAESLFGYARRQRSTVDDEPLWDRVAAALSICGVHRDEVLDLAKQERAHGLPPGEADTLPA